MDESELVSLDGDGKEVPVDNLVFVDDRRLFGATMEELVHRVRQCIRGTLIKGGAVHTGKLELLEFVLQDGMTKQVEVDMPFFGTRTSTKQVPSVVGIPLFGDQLPREHFWKLVKVVKSLKAGVGGG